MSMGGDFYAMTDDQLERLLDGRLPFERFLYDEGDERPRECFSDFEHLWFELTQVLDTERACGHAQGDEIPEACGYSDSDEVARTAAMLERLDDVAIRERCEQSNLEASGDEIVSAVQAVTAFYARAAANKDAVLFRIT